ncbi:LysR family transcriptional regulator [Lactobacillus sp. R2/2]|nr:LysR family transcriptional regulator [Lactobacillus sp. R2/2]
MMKYSLLAYKYFVDVVETQGFTPAAKRNFVSQTAISNAIKNLEKQLGVQLIDRSTSHFKVTLAGSNLYHCAIPLLNTYYEFGEKITQLNNSFSILKIHYLHGFGFGQSN